MLNVAASDRAFLELLLRKSRSGSEGKPRNRIQGASTERTKGDAEV